MGFIEFSRNALTGINRILTESTCRNYYTASNCRNALTGINRILTLPISHSPTQFAYSRNALTGINRILTEGGGSVGLLGYPVVMPLRALIGF